MVLAKAAIHAGFDIKFQFADRLDCEAQRTAEDSRGQAGTDESGKEVHLLVE